MYKFTNHLTNSSLILIRKQIKDGSCSTLILLRNPKRQYAQDPACPQPPPQRPSRKLLYGTLGTIVIAGSAIVYAKNSPEVRSWLESNVPWANNVITVVYQENKTIPQVVSGQFEKIKNTVGDFVFGKEGITPVPVKSRTNQDLEAEAKVGFDEKTYPLPAPVLEPLYTPEVETGTPGLNDATLVQTEKCPPQPKIHYSVSKDVVDIEHDMHENTRLAIDEFKKCTKACADYNKALYKVFEPESPDAVPSRYYNSLKGLSAARGDSMQKAKDYAEKARAAMDQLEEQIEKEELNAPKDRIAMTLRYIRNFRDDINKAEMNCEEEYEKFALSEKYKEKVMAARNQYKSELQMLFPNIDLNARLLDPKGETDLLLLYTLKQITSLQTSLAEAQTIRDAKIAQAIKCMDAASIADAKAEDLVLRDRMARELEFQKKVTVEARNKQNEQLRKQAELHEQITKARLDAKEKEINSKFNKAASELVEKERVQCKKDLAAMAGKLQAIEDTLKKRAAAENEARKSQSLWTAAEALLSATRKPGSETKVDEEIKALEKAGKDDKLVQTVVKGISKDARENGIVTEEYLRNKFDTLEKTAAKVALIGRDGATLPMYFLSWLQSKFLFQKLAEIPASELENNPTDFSQLDTFDIIQRARYFMNHGNLQHALRYINLLQGAPRAAARCWVEDAKRHLEVKQAAETVMAHASLSGMLDS